MKRVIPVILVILLGVAICVPCFADGGSMYYTVTGTCSYDGLSAVVVYADGDFTGAEWHNGTAIYVRPSATFRIGTIRLINNTEDVRYVTLSSGYVISLSNNEFYINPNSYFDVTFTVSTTVATPQSFNINQFTVSDYSYSLWNQSGIISNIKNMFSFVSGSDILPLFLIGITVSLGLVACKFIRKVMWSR